MRKINKEFVELMMTKTEGRMIEQHTVSFSARHTDTELIASLVVYDVSVNLMSTTVLKENGLYSKLNGSCNNRRL